uniref:Uncharacterized protein n=1 Tax=Timema monikensis TaxID=170555 RepID=A0A7R9E346_9NEOP|nr:unnamed protein product [Timema monikensis]
MASLAVTILLSSSTEAVSSLAVTRLATKRCCVEAGLCIPHDITLKRSQTVGDRDGQGVMAYIFGYLTLSLKVHQNLVKKLLNNNHIGRLQNGVFTGLKELRYLRQDLAELSGASRRNRGPCFRIQALVELPGVSRRHRGPCFRTQALVELPGVSKRNRGPCFMRQALNTGFGRTTWGFKEEQRALFQETGFGRTTWGFKEEQRALFQNTGFGRTTWGFKEEQRAWFRETGFGHAIVEQRKHRILLFALAILLCTNYTNGFGIGKVEFRGSELTFAWRESGLTFTGGGGKPQCIQPGSNPDLPIIDSLVQHDSSATCGLSNNAVDALYTQGTADMKLGRFSTRVFLVAWLASLPLKQRLISGEFPPCSIAHDSLHRLP